MPNVGDIEYKYGRVYIYTQPDASKGPGTWRPSNPDELAGPGNNGGGSGATYKFDGEPPINVDVVNNLGNPANVVTTSIDLKQLSDRTQIEQYQQFSVLCE